MAEGSSELKSITFDDLMNERLNGDPAGFSEFFQSTNGLERERGETGVLPEMEISGLRVPPPLIPCTPRRPPASPSTHSQTYTFPTQTPADPGAANRYQKYENLKAESVAG
ncbi:hypothetical protein L208DRAFT_1382272 [Tricholoma matsutake]|nr:hypothetical protein L208DRAFT_1382272 [Tricholoma matsutake 945]